MHVAVSGEGDLHTDIAGPRGPTGPNGPKKQRGKIRRENITHAPFWRKANETIQWQLF